MSVLPRGLRILARRTIISGGIFGGVFLICLLGHDAAAAPASKPALRPMVPSGSKGDKGPRALLREALGLYVRGRYAAAAAHLDPLVQQRSLSDRADQIEALRTYGVTLYLSGARPGAERAFRNLLRLAPDERLDPDFVRPGVVRFFDDVRRRYRRELDAMVARSAPKGSAVVNLLPPWGQFQNGHRKKAFGILGGLLTTGVAAIATFGVWEGLVHADGTFDIADSTAQGLKIGNLVAVGLFVGIYIYGVVDGLVYYFRRRRAHLGASSRRGNEAALHMGMDGLRLVF
ncbi:MAG: hypothetical protein KAI47_23370 [Deltaproteobacteria bacterium]|nr:hypothetical protein [Deltaproteobacteria bacterium]